VHWFGVEFHATVVTQKFDKITILLLQCYSIRDRARPGIWHKGIKQAITVGVSACYITLLSRYWPHMLL